MKAIAAGILAFGLGIAFSAPGAAAAADFRWEQMQKRPGATLWFKESTEVREARRHLRTGRAYEAIRLAEDALSLDLKFRDRRGALNILCIGYVELNAALLALPHCDDLVRLAPREWRSFNNRANAHFALGRFDKAVSDYETALEWAVKAEKRPDDAEATGPEGPEEAGPENEGPNILSMDEVRRPSALVKKNLEMARSMLDSASRL